MKTRNSVGRRLRNLILTLICLIALFLTTSLIAIFIVDAGIPKIKELTSPEKESSTYQTQHFIIQSGLLGKEGSLWLAQAAENWYDIMVKDWGLKPPSEPVLIRVKDIGFTGLARESEIIIDEETLQKESLLAHEFFHVLQRNYYNTSQPRWLEEGMANWAQNRVSPSLYGLEATAEALLNPTKSLQNRDYDALVFWEFLTQKTEKDEELIKKVLQATKKKKGQAAVKEALLSYGIQFEQILDQWEKEKFQYSISFLGKEFLLVYFHFYSSLFSRAETFCLQNF